MSEAIEISNVHQAELLREAISRQSPLTLTCRQDQGWTTANSRFLGFDRASGDLLVAAPSGPRHLVPDITEGQTIGVSFRRAHRQCVFETTVTGWCLYSLDPEESCRAMRLLWPDGVLELRRRFYYRTPLPPHVNLPVQVRLCDPSGVCEEQNRSRWGRMLNLSVGGLSLQLKGDDNPRWRSNTPVLCWFVAEAGHPPVSLYGHMRYLDQYPDGTIRMGVHFLGLETSSEARPTLEQILELTRCFQEMEMKRLAAAVECDRHAVVPG